MSEPAPEISSPPLATGTHFAVHGDWRSVFTRYKTSHKLRRRWWTRTMCGERRMREVEKSLELRVNAVVSCPTCMIVKDKWLELGGPLRFKAMTIRRAREFIKGAFPKGWPSP